MKRNRKMQHEKNKISKEWNAAMQEQMDKLKEEFSNVLVELVDTTKPALDEVTKVGEEFFDKSGTAAVNAGLNMVGAVPGVGTTVELVRVINNVGQAFNAGVDAAADLAKVGSDTAVKVHEITEKAGDLVEEASDLADNASNLTELPDTSIPKLIDEPPEGVQVAGGIMRTLNQLQKAGKRIENRVESSLKEFHKNTKTRKKVRFNL